MNIAKIYADRDLVIKAPDGSDTDITIKVRTAESKEFFEVLTRHAEQAMMRDGKLSSKDAARNNAELVAAVISGWSGLEDDNGPIPYSPQKALELMLKPELSFIREQVEVLAAKRANFFRGISKQAGGESAAGGSAQHSTKARSAVKTRDAALSEAS